MNRPRLSRLLGLLGLMSLAFATSALAQPATKWYLAEGATGPIFAEEINIGNPNGVAADVTVTLLLPDGTTIPHTLTVPATSRATVRVNDIPGAGATAASAVVESTNGQEIVVDRAMRYPVATERFAHAANGVLAPALTWYLAEGATGFFEQFVLIQNPNATDAQVTVTFLPSTGTPVVQNYTVTANSRFTIWVNQMVAGLAAAEFSTVVQVTNGQPVIAERAMYFNNFSGGMDEVGVTAPAMTWLFAEGFTGTAFGTLAFDTFLLLANPNATQAQVDVTYYREGATPVEETYAVNANSRRTIWIDKVAGLDNVSFGIRVASQNVPVLAERAMYWGPGGWVDGTAVAGVAAEATKWAFAGGRAGGFKGRFYETYYLVSNASANPLALQATFYREDGTGIVRTFNVPAQSRFTIIANAYAELSNQRFAAVLEATNGVAFVAERAAYSSATPGGAWEGGNASFGVPWTNAAVAPPAPPAATLTGISPNFGPADGGTAITLTGTNFVQGAQVYLGGTQATGVVVQNATTITAVTAPRAAATVDVVVTNAGVNLTIPGGFTYEAVAPPPPPPPPSGFPNGPPIATFPQSSALPDRGFSGIIVQLANQRPDLLLTSCATQGGNHNFIYEAVRQLRRQTGSNRWGLNIKRGNQGLSEDVVTYYFGNGFMEGATEVFIIDIIGNHCPISGRPIPAWQDVTQATANAGTIGRWTENGQNLNGPVTAP